MRFRVRTAVVAVAMSAGVVVPISAAPALADDQNAVVIDGGASGTASATVTVGLPAPTDSSALIRLSDDGGTSWVQLPWTTTLQWSLTDPDAGGPSFDGVHTVTVDGGDGTTWQRIGQASILLDTTGPSASGPQLFLGDGFHGSARVQASDPSGVRDVQLSLDQEHWASFDHDAPNGAWTIDFSLQDQSIGGYLGAGQRTIWVREIDGLGNVSDAQPIDDTPTVDYSRFPATFDYPRPAVTGHLFTIEPHFDAGYTAASDQFCVWRMVWGDRAARMKADENESYGELETSVPTVDGVCQPWTFTLPYGPVPEYSWTLDITSKADESQTSFPFGDLTFVAGVDSTSRAVTQSNLPLVYTVPDRTEVDADGYVTYRLFSVGGASTDDGQWTCNPSSGSPLSAWSSQKGGDVFRCKVSTTAPYTAFWDREVDHREWRAGYDPMGDVSRPVVSAVRAAPAPGSDAGRTQVSWRGTDKGTGLRRFELQVSRNGGRWAGVTVPTARATSVTRATSAGTSYRYRVRAYDRAGNVSAWAYSLTGRAANVDDALLRYSTGWTSTVTTGATGGRTHMTGRAGAVATGAVTASAIAVLATRGPAQGYLQVFLDGRLTATVDLQSARAATPGVVWSTTFAASGRHTVRLRVLGTSGHPNVALDGLAIQR